MKKLIMYVLPVLFIGLVLGGCKKDEDPGVAPDIPPEETMAIDFSTFTSEKVFDVSKSVNSQLNYGVAAITVGFWNIVVYSTLAVPVSAFSYSFAHSAEYLGDATWEWTYDVAGFASTYYARLTGEIRTNDIKWEMYVSKDGIGGFDEFKWFEGESNLDGKSGSWMLYHSSEFPDELMEIDWTVENEEVGTIRLTYVRENDNSGNPDPGNGSYLEYSHTDATDYNAMYDIHYYDTTHEQFVDADIQWNLTEYYGRVRNTMWDDNAWHCWDSNGDDVVCGMK
jgi:hypothetical protein